MHLFVEGVIVSEGTSTSIRDEEEIALFVCMMYSLPRSFVAETKVAY